MHQRCAAILAAARAGAQGRSPRRGPQGGGRGYDRESLSWPQPRKGWNGQLARAARQPAVPRPQGRKTFCAAASQDVAWPFARLAAGRDRRVARAASSQPSFPGLSARRPNTGRSADRPFPFPARVALASPRPRAELPALSAALRAPPLSRFWRRRAVPTGRAGRGRPGRRPRQCPGRRNRRTCGPGPGLKSRAGSARSRPGPG